MFPKLVVGGEFALRDPAGYLAVRRLFDEGLAIEADAGELVVVEADSKEVGEGSTSSNQDEKLLGGDDDEKPEEKKEEKTDKLAVKKGFLNDEKNKGELYGEGGSTQGHVSQEQKKSWAEHDMSERLNSKCGFGVQDEY